MMDQKKITLLLSQLQGIAQSGLQYAGDVYDLERYQELLALTQELTAALTSLPAEKIQLWATSDQGYATPKVDIRGLVFHEKRLLLVQEKKDGRWALPGGWGDIGYSPFEVVEKEVWEEAGIKVKARQLVAVRDMAKHDYPYTLAYIYKFFITASWIAGELAGGVETASAKFFSLEEIKDLDLSLERNSFADIQMAFSYQQEPFPTICD